MSTSTSVGTGIIQYTLTVYLSVPGISRVPQILLYVRFLLYIYFCCILCRAAMAALFPCVAFVDNFYPRLVVAHVCVEPLECFLHSFVVGGGPLGSLIAFVFWESGLWFEFCLLGKRYCCRLTCRCVCDVLLLQVAGAHPLMV